jgi:hypothetical protein
MHNSVKVIHNFEDTFSHQMYLAITPSKVSELRCDLSMSMPESTMPESNLILDPSSIPKVIPVGKVELWHEVRD